MATWDGSYYGSEEPSYYVYPSQSNTTPNPQNWSYSSEGQNQTSFQNRSAGYPQNGSVVFNQSGALGFQGVNATTVPPNVVPPNGGSLPNMYQEHAAPTANCDIFNTVYNPECFYEDNRVRQRAPNWVSKSSNDTKNKNNSSGSTSRFSGKRKTVDSNVVKHSNLQATANEFIPNSVKFSRKNTFASGNKDRKPPQNCNVEVAGEETKQELRAGSVNTFYMDNRGRFSEKRQGNRRNFNYKGNELQENQYRSGSTFVRSPKGNFHSHGNVQNDRNYSGRKNTMRHSEVRASETTKLAEASVDVSVNANIASSANVQLNDSQIQHVGNAINEYDGSYKIDQAYTNENVFESAANLQQYDNHSNKPNFSIQDTDSENTQINNGRNLPNGSISAKYREKRDRNDDRYDSGYKDRRNNYQDYNDCKGYNYERGEKMRDRDRNRDVFRDSENWRKKSDNSGKISINQRKSSKRNELDDDASQRERLTEQLNRGQLECLVCCDFIKQNDHTWSCQNCYHVLHLRCVKKWAKSSQSENGWRCPACQNVTMVIPEEYFCFCGKMKSPEWNRRDTAHSCGETCGGIRSKNNCAHKCTLLCHPGACPLCIAMVTKYCGCGRTFRTVQCSNTTLLTCDEICGKELNCGKHTCEQKCHHGDCGFCEKMVHQDCFCGKYSRDVRCELNVPSLYTCSNVCDKLLDCGNHRCTEQCHSGPCGSCVLKPESVTHCCCGQTPLEKPRESCLDEVPTCDKVCNKPLKCGQPSNPHTCKALCHHGDCPACESTSNVKCRCGNMDKEIECKNLMTKADDARCEKKCTKKRSCGKHKCNQLCCIDIEHICPLPCSKTLSCGRHKCEQTCHKGRCQPCWRSSFDELYCECGAATIFPPVPCGTRRPTCDRPCSRDHPCTHEVLHNCHSEPVCPPCTVLTQKWCYGNHELRKAVPCYVNEVSCGLPCGKPLSCGRHKCITICHSGPCEKPGYVCVQPCTTQRELCGHICGAACHEGKCPDVPCKETVKVTCQCGHRSMTRACAENSRDYQRIASGILASKMADMQLGHSVDLEEVFGQGSKKQNQLKTLECNDECKTIERNRRLALGLQIVNPDLSGKLMPRYSEFMKQWAKKDPYFCQTVHDRLTELVQLSKTSKHKSRSYSFEIMNRDKRQFVHECCEQFGCESQAYDQEPKRNVVATAVKDKCWLPSLSLLKVVQRENGQRKVPGPMLNSSRSGISLRNVDVLPLATKKLQKSQTPASRSRSPEPEIDYFDYKG
ncbi:protein shuttle craft [Orussus abietinus]|uniref:protein shuttle craft n=1 Tax=Orussus abietinus TaxID=222816 RepID=UPI000626E5AE|nr:protein shuttle craft [Orussus abietinus]